MASLTEKDFQASVVQAAKALGYLVYHTYDSRKSEKGFPDLVLVHPGKKRTFFLELKTQRGKVTPEQSEWLNALDKAGQNAGIIRPQDWDFLMELLN